MTYYVLINIAFVGKNSFVLMCGCLFQGCFDHNTELFPLLMGYLLVMNTLAGVFMCNECLALKIVGFILPSVCFVFVRPLSLFLCVAAESYIELVTEICELTGRNCVFSILFPVKYSNHYHLPSRIRVC